MRLFRSLKREAHLQVPLRDVDVRMAQHAGRILGP
jgi:hypothetical protein